MKSRLCQYIILGLFFYGLSFFAFSSSCNAVSQPKSKKSVETTVKNSAEKKANLQKTGKTSSNKNTVTIKSKKNASKSAVSKKTYSKNETKQKVNQSNKQNGKYVKITAKSTAKTKNNSRVIFSSKNSKIYSHANKKTVHAGVTAGKTYKSLNGKSVSFGSTSVSHSYSNSSRHRIYHDANFCPSLVSLGNNVVKIARGQLGARYKSGGFSPTTGFDCSGFVHWVYSQYGFYIPRDSASQKFIGKPVDKTSLLPGDVLVFSVGRRSRSGYHSVIYIGRGNFIHSPNSKSSVRVNSLSEDYWASHSYVARRLLNDEVCQVPKSKSLPFLKNNIE